MNLVTFWFGGILKWFSRVPCPPSWREPWNDFIFSICSNHVKSISANSNHPLFNCVLFNNLKRSSRIPALSTAQRSTVHRSDQKAFFQYFMKCFNKGSIYLTRARPFQYYQPCNWIDTEMENK